MKHTIPFTVLLVAAAVAHAGDRENAKDLPSQPASAAVPALTPTPSVAKRAATPTPATVTQAYGRLPDTLPGVWLLTLQTATKNGPVNNWHIYRIEHRGEQWNVQRYERPKPSPVDAEFADAKEKKVEFQPSERVIKELKASLPKLTLLPGHQTFRVVALRAANEIPTDPTPPPAAKNAKFSLEVLDQTTQSNSVSAVSFYAKDVQRDRISGDTHAITILSAGLGVFPIEMPGTFRMYRLE